MSFRSNKEHVTNQVISVLHQHAIADTHVLWVKRLVEENLFQLQEYGPR